jgi:hypothetical protein
MMKAYVIQFELWHASHALTREYATVLHLHKLESSTPLGPVYEYPGARELMVNAIKGKERLRRQWLLLDRQSGEERRTLTALIACRH